MAKVDPQPNQKEITKRREPKWVINPREVNQKDELRVRQWGLDIMKKHEHRLNNKKYKNKEIVYQQEMDPEEIDIRNIYPFQDLQWFIMKLGSYWVLRILYKTPDGNHAILAELRYVHTDHI